MCCFVLAVFLLYFTLLYCRWAPDTRYKLAQVQHESSTKQHESIVLCTLQAKSEMDLIGMLRLRNGGRAGRSKSPDTAGAARRVRDEEYAMYTACGCGRK